MILSDKKIRELLANKSLIIDPIADNAIQPSSIDCRLGSHFLVIDEYFNDNGVLSFDK